MSYTDPTEPTDLEPVLEFEEFSFTGTSLDFEMSPMVTGATIKVKIGGVIVEKPLMIKIGGVVRQASAITVKTNG